MASPAPVVARRCSSLAVRTQKRSLSSACLRITSSQYQHQRRRTVTQDRSGRRWQTTDAAVPANPKISGIVDQISQLTLLETADLVASLKTRLNIPDISFAPPPSASSSGPAPAAAAVEEDEPAPAAQEKSLFTLKLESFEAAAKPKIIKEVKAMLGLSLVDSKKFVESAPKVLKDGVSKEEADKIVTLLKGLGAVVSVD